jgi:epoxyqueuosine reductase
LDFSELARDIVIWGRELGFAELGIADTELSTDEARLGAWLDAGHHGEMDYMARHGARRARPSEVVPGTIRVITARLDYLPRRARDPDDVLSDSRKAYISRYALGRDYHKVMRQRLQQLADRIGTAIRNPADNSVESSAHAWRYRVFTDSAPVLEVALAAKAGLGWRGKHTLLLTRDAGSFFFLGEIYTDLPLPVTAAVSAHCGTCRACLDVCPTGAIVAPYELDARRCISYLTIEHEGAIPVGLRAAMGNRIYGCDDCQLACPWNKYAVRAALADFDVRAALANPTLLQLWDWSETEFLHHTEGSAIRRIGYTRWQRNLAVALGNALRATGDPAIEQALLARRDSAAPLLREHVDWALAQGRPAQSAGAAASMP